MNLKRIIWLLLLLSLVFSFSGFNLRLNNESQNNNLVSVADYLKFWEVSQSANKDINGVLDELQSAGVYTIAVRENTLQNMAKSGDIFIYTYLDFSSQMAVTRPNLWGVAQEAVGNEQIGSKSLVAVSFDPENTAFLKERLASRFEKDEIINFSADGFNYFIINAELSQLEKTKGASIDLDARLGFDEALIKNLQDKGFDIVLRPGINIGSNTAYLQDYEQIIRDFDVRYLIFDGQEITGFPENLNVMRELLDKYNLIIGVIEPSDQIRYYAQKGLAELMLDTDYPINRVYSTSNDEFVNSIDDRYYRWIRGVVDRNIRILYILPFQDSKLIYSENLAATIAVTDRFHDTITAKGYNINQPIERLSNEMPGPIHRLMLSLSLLFGSMLYLMYLFKPKKAYVLGLLALGALGAVLLNLVINADFTKVYALIAAILYPAFSSLLLLLYLKEHRDKSLWVNIPISLAIILSVNAIGMYTVVTSLADIRYIMSIETFSGVKIAFMLPLLLFVLNYYSSFGAGNNLWENIKEALQKQPSYLVLIATLAAIVILYVYLARSGNASGIGVSSIELRVREILEMMFLARPRFKEFIIGYPALFAMVYLYRQYKQDFILLIFGLAMMMGSISMINSFSHVFTSISISASRTLSGLLVGVVLGILTLIGIKVLEKAVSFFYKYE